jgi:tRNA uridine 5-carbamoylmethylation protein Kti12
MTKKELFDELEKDLELTPNNLLDKVYEVPKLYNKWQRIYFSNKKKLNKKSKELDALYKQKYYYYKDGDRLLDNAKEINFNVLSDEEYAKLRLEVETLKDLVKVLEQSIDRIGKISFDIKNIIAWNEFLNGR